jgi:peptidoglycan L-alanyl-D-glutamate endopeptidase CwlK
MPFVLGSTSKKNLARVHPDLVRVARRAIELTPVDFRITQGARTMAEQKRLVAAGASKTLNSRHVLENNKSGLACAVDVVALLDGKIKWDWPLYPRIAKAFKQAAKELGVPLEWGGECFGKRFIDGPHFQLPWRQYP